MKKMFNLFVLVLFCFSFIIIAQAALGDRLENAGIDVNQEKIDELKDRVQIDINQIKSDINSDGKIDSSDWNTIKQDLINDANSAAQQVKKVINSEEFWNKVQSSEYNSQIVPVIVSLKKNCVPQKQTLILLAASKTIFTSDSSTYKVVAIQLGQIPTLVADPCVDQVSQSQDKNEFLVYVKETLQAEVEQKIADMNLQQYSRGLDVNSLKELIVAPANPDQGGNGTPGQISSYQSYVTPSDSSITSISTGKTPEQIYLTASSWPWVSEETLNDTSELWFTPKVFLTQTPTMSTNPIPGKAVDDCEEHANALVSALRASGVSADQVRVGLGTVNFGGEIGGHAWAEIYIDGSWVVLDSTSGPYWDDAQKKEVMREPLPYDYWAIHRFPVVQHWAYYNDQYYYEIGGKNNSPSTWGTNSSAQDALLEKSFSTASVMIDTTPSDQNNPTNNPNELNPTDNNNPSQLIINPDNSSQNSSGMVIPIVIGIIVVLVVVVGIFLMKKKA